MANNPGSYFGVNLPPPYPAGPDSSPAGGHYDGVNASNKDKAHILTRAFYAFRQKRLPTVGVGNYAYENLRLAKFSFIGAGVRNRQQIFATLAHPQVYIYGQALPLTGLGGVVAGQIVFQPLVDPYNNTVG